MALFGIGGVAGFTGNVGYGGIYSSVDGESVWTLKYTWNGTVTTWADGITGTVMPPRMLHWLHPTAGPIDAFLAVSQQMNGSCLSAITSNDGLSWTSAAIPGTIGWYLAGYTGNNPIYGGNSVIWDDVQFVFACFLPQNNNWQYKIFTSSDGINWTQQASLALNANNLYGYISSLSYDGTYYVLMLGNGQYYISTDLINWTIHTKIDQIEPFGPISNGNGLWITSAVNSQTYTSTDLIHWTSHQGPGGILAAVKWVTGVPNPNGSGFVDMFIANNGHLCWSMDGINWSLNLNSSRGLGVPLDIVYDPSLGLYLLSNESALYVSASDTPWTNHTGLTFLRILGVAKVNAAHTIGSIASIQNKTYQTITGAARLFGTPRPTLTGCSSIYGNTHQLTVGRSRVQTTTSQDIPSDSRIYNTTFHTMISTSRLVP